LIELEKLTEIIGYSFITSEYNPESLAIRGSSGKEWVTLEKRNFKKLPLNYQMPLYYFNGTQKTLPQPKVKEVKEVKSQKIDRNILKKYYKQKINPSIVPDFKKKMYDHKNDVYYFLYDEYDLNKSLVSKDLVIGFVVQNDKVHSAVLYEDNDGNRSGFNLRNRDHKRYWDNTIMIKLAFE
jgi:hypothetical protein